jgi:signal transduction histidine kinase
MPETSDGRSDVAVKLRQLHDVTREMIGAESRRPVYDAATAAASDLLGFEYDTIREYDAERDALVPVAASPELLARDGERTTCARGESIQREAVDVGDVLAFQDVAAVDDGVDRRGDGSMIVVPLGETGILTLGSPTPLDVGSDDVQLARVLGVILETAVDRVDRLRTLREREEALRRKHERLDRFAGLVAHEFRNPLATVSGHLASVEGTDGDRRHLATARDATDRMDRLTESLLDLVRTDELTGPVTTVDVGALAETVAAKVCPSTVSLVVDPVAVRANRDRTWTVIQNLFENAVTYGGRAVTVHVGPLADGGFYAADDGPGFDVDDPAELFAYRASGGADSTGLGLAIVRDVATAHGWDVSATRNRFGGARVELRTDPDPDRRRTTTVEPAPAPGRDPDPDPDSDPDPDPAV